MRGPDLIAGVSLLLLASAGAVLAQPAPHFRVSGLKPGELVVRVFDVGQGQCVLIECPDDPPILNDCGKMGSGGRPDQATASLRKRLAEYRAVYGAPFLRVVISHPHQDHFSLLVAKKHGFVPDDVSVLYFSGPWAKFSRPARDWINGVSILRTGRGYDGVCGGQIGVSCLTPNQSAFPWAPMHCGAAAIDLLTANALSHQRAGKLKPLFTGSSPNGESAMLRIRYQGASILLPGDAEQVSQHFAAANATAAGLPLDRTSVLLAPHHGSHEKGSNDLDWVRAVSPATVVVSSNEGGGYGHPHCDSLERFDQARYADGDEMVRSDGPLALRCGLNGDDVVEQTFSHQFVLTEQVGDITVRIRLTGLTLDCQRPGPSCRRATPAPQ